MFTGLVEALGTVRTIAPDGPGKLLEIAEPRLVPELTLGESVAVNGVCLTVVARTAETFSFQVGPETLRLTNLGELQGGAQVNLERSLKVGDRLGGHIVQGHVDGVGHIDLRERMNEWEMLLVFLSTGTVCPDGSQGLRGHRWDQPYPGGCEQCDVQCRVDSPHARGYHPRLQTDWRHGEPGDRYLRQIHRQIPGNGASRGSAAPIIPE